MCKSFDELTYLLDTEGSGASIHDINFFKYHIKACIERHPDDSTRERIVKEHIEEALRTKHFFKISNALHREYDWSD